MSRLKNIALFSILMLYLVIMSGTISDSRKQLLCNGYEIFISDSLKTGFLTQDDIINILYSRANNLGKPVSTINLEETENILTEYLAVRSAECYITEDGKLHVNIKHREPAVRIINANDKSYYLDKEGFIIPLSKHFSPNVIIANGNIYEPFDIAKTRNIFQPDNELIPKSRQIIFDLLKLVNYLNQSEFWTSQIEQVYVNDKYEFELTPRIGPHIILFGSISDYKEKLDNLKSLYIESFNKSGWNDYVFINLKFKNQIICTKR